MRVEVSCDGGRSARPLRWSAFAVIPQKSIVAPVRDAYPGSPRPSDCSVAIAMAGASSRETSVQSCRRFRPRDRKRGRPSENAE